jgi:hypothetical protein
VGTEGTVSAEWAINFSGLSFSNFLFASGDFLNFVYNSKSFLNVNSNGSAGVFQTSNSQTATTIFICNQDSFARHPFFGTTTSFTASLAAKSILYCEDEYSEYLPSF